ncbi:MAG: site-specific DNA-methyltransferase [Verrucomicrobiaceae bacterium]|nr:MAG: site-specific DNA-methyltransferase [Verrucomicrobiaceae bacterium]
MKQKLELTWVGKDLRPRLEPRIMLETESFIAPHRVREGDLFDNLLVQGDNLLALRSLEQDYAGTVKCVYIDPPFNTGQAFEHYNDSLEHSTWLGLMRDRLEILHRLLMPQGSIFVHIDNEEGHYLKVILDEIFGRQNFLATIAYERSGVSGIGQGGAFLVNTHEYIHAYAKDKSRFKVVDARGASEITQEDVKRYSKILVSEGRQELVAEFMAPATGEPVRIYRHEGEVIESVSLRNYDQRRKEILSQIAGNFGRVFRTTSVQEENEFQNRIMSQCGTGLYSATYLSSRGKKQGEWVQTYYWNKAVFAWLSDTAELRDGQVVRTNKLSDFWSHRDIPKADLANEGGVDFRRGKKPENLLRRILQLVTTEGDLVLDSFAGSGTTGAVAHKMGRRWILIELRDQATTHIVPRLKKVLDGTDQGGISKVVGWSGGGGFRFYRLAPSLLKKDRWDRWVINDAYNDVMLAEALCKLEGFHYRPSDAVYWQQGQSTERDFLYVTTQTLTHAQLVEMSEEVGDDRSLLVLAMAFKGSKPDAYPNLTLKKIPNQVLSRCEWGKDDYSLKIENLPQAPKPVVDQEALFEETEG